jgi:hypothetical protein
MNLKTLVQTTTGTTGTTKSLGFFGSWLLTRRVIYQENISHCFFVVFAVFVVVNRFF